MRPIGDSRFGDWMFGLIDFGTVYLVMPFAVIFTAVVVVALILSAATSIFGDGVQTVTLRMNEWECSKTEMRWVEHSQGSKVKRYWRQLDPVCIQYDEIKP
jgi:hypothetical protein